MRLTASNVFRTIFLSFMQKYIITNITKSLYDNQGVLCSYTRTYILQKFSNVYNNDKAGFTAGIDNTKLISLS